MINVKLANSFDLEANQTIKTAVANTENQLGDKGRLLLRPSRTEPVLRVMVEGEDNEVVTRLAQELSDLVAEEVSRD